MGPQITTRGDLKSYPIDPHTMTPGVMSLCLNIGRTGSLPLVAPYVHMMVNTYDAYFQDTTPLFISQCLFITAPPLNPAVHRQDMMQDDMGSCKESSTCVHMAGANGILFCNTWCTVMQSLVWFAMVHVQVSSHTYWLVTWDRCDVCTPHVKQLHTANQPQAIHNKTCVTLCW